MLGNYLENVREKSPLVHCITNYVTVNDVANTLIACGASPVMSDEAKDVKDIVSVSSGLCINIGTLNEKSIKAMLIAGKTANNLKKPILLDPVGSGASRLRTRTAEKIIEKCRPSIIRGNISEIKSLSLGTGSTKGVDASSADTVTENNLDENIRFAKNFASQTGATVAITGAIDLVANKNQCYVIRNGHPSMSSITGTGCMLSALTVAFVCANPSNVTDAVASAVCTMGLSGEIGKKMLADNAGNASLRTHIIDAIYNMDANTLNEGARYEIR